MSDRFRAIRVFCMCLVFVWPSISSISAKAQLSPQEQAMAQIINSVQTGTENWARFTPQLRDLILSQTGGTGAYVGLAQLGNPLAIHMTQVIQLPAGHYYIFRTAFNAGVLDWQVVADMNGNIWGLQFQPVASQAPNQPKPTTQQNDDDDDPDTTPTLPSGGKKKGEKPKTKDDACKLYPNLC